MIRLLIVEDERIIRNGIEKHVLWDDIGVDEVKAAEHAEEALTLCKEYAPDIIISDIRMPGINGVDLCTILREQYPECQIIFISGFSDKEYLKAGITLGAISYVEKPINLPELTDAVIKAVESVHRVKRLSTNILRSLLSSSSTERERAFASLDFFECGKKLKEEKTFVIGLIQTKGEILDSSALNVFPSSELSLMADVLESNLYVLLFSTKRDEVCLGAKKRQAIGMEILQNRREKETWFIGLGMEVNSISRLVTSYESAKEALKSLSYKGWNNFALFEEKRMEYLDLLSEEKRSHFEALLLQKKKEDALRFLHDIANELVEHHAVISFPLRNAFFMLDDLVGKVDKTLNFTDLSKEGAEHLVFLNQAETIREMEGYVAIHVEEVLEENEEEQKNNYLIKHAIEYMNQHYDKKDLTIQVLAEEVYLTPTYLSSLFKKKTKMTIGHYLTDIRMKQAKDLLKDHRLKLYQVAELVGYEDANYFAKIFKKKTGMLPSEYREIS